MGYRLHYASKYEVEYAGGYFNWHTDEANQFLEELGFYAFDESRSVFEIAKEALKAKVDALRAEYIRKADEVHPVLSFCTCKEILTTLDEIINGTAGDMVHLEWF